MVCELPMWMGYTARWRVRCVSLAEANEILAGCKRLEKENRRREHLHFQERLLNTPLTKRGKGVEVVKVAGVARAMGVLVTLTDPLPPMEKEEERQIFQQNPYP